VRDVPSVLAPALAAALRSAVTGWLAALPQEQRDLAQDVAGGDGPELREWTYLPGQRPGLRLADMAPGGQEAALGVLDVACSPSGARTVREVMRLDGVLRVLEESRGRAGAERRDPGSYWWRVLGDPSADGPWLVRVSGHHVVVHARVVGDRVSGTPSFLGANPARVPVQVPDGPRPGYRALPAEQLLGHAVLASLDADQRAVAVVAPQPPPDVATRHDPLAHVDSVPRGVRHDALDAGQARLLELLVRRHLDRLPPALAGSAWRALVDEGLAGVTFAWQGGTGGPVVGEPYYYAVRGESFLLEHDCVQSRGNHVHDVWRDVRSDWGRDVLAEHRREQPHP
jgi:hypothetical protein